jgi:heme-degrading monooxygenase HmoA
MTTAESSPEQLDNAITHYREQVAAQLKTQPGFVGAAMHVNRTTGARVSLIAWDTEEALQASEQTAERLRAEVGSVGGRVTNVDRFELLLQARNGPPKPGAFSRNTDIQGSPDQIDATVEFAREQGVPLLKQQPGFRSVFVWANRQTGRVIVTSMWDSAAEREASDTTLRAVRPQANGQQVSVALYESVYEDLGKLPSHAGS